MGCVSQLSFQIHHSWRQHSQLVYRYLPSQAHKDHLKCHLNQLVISDKFYEKMIYQVQHTQS